MTVRAYLYCGDWIGDCTRPGCANAEHLFGLRNPAKPAGPNNPRNEQLAIFRCSNCLHLDGVEWPGETFMAQAAAVLALRPVPQTRNWYPQDHAGAVKFGTEHGQTIPQLLAENITHGVDIPV